MSYVVIQYFENLGAWEAVQVYGPFERKPEAVAFAARKSNPPNTRSSFEAMRVYSPKGR